VKTLGGREGMLDKERGIRAEAFRPVGVQIGQEQKKLVEEGALVAVTEDESLMDPGAKRNCVMESPDLPEQSEGLTGVAHDIGGLGVGLAGLMQQFDGWHLASAFALLDAIGQDHEAAVASDDSGMDLEDQASPDPGKLVGTQGAIVEEIQEAAVTAHA